MTENIITDGKTTVVERWYYPELGEPLMEVVLCMVNLANKEEVIVKANFNGAVLIAKPGTKTYNIIHDYYTQLNNRMG